MDALRPFLLARSEGPTLARHPHVQGLVVILRGTRRLLPRRDHVTAHVESGMVGSGLWPAGLCGSPTVRSHMSPIDDIFLRVDG